ncbi:MAG: M67 family metallopeptidase [Rhodospirillales bacterium]|nr:M67 family metallopeptidase [Rhodospirillales bacterium]
MIFLARAHLREIADAAEAAYPGECCGLLIGRSRPGGEIEVTHVAKSRNLGKERGRFEIDPQLWVDVTRAHRGGTARVVGLYHSHPDAPAQPSAIDLEAAWGEELVWLIVSVDGDEGRGQAVHCSAHILDHGGRQFREIPLRTNDWQPYPVRILPEGNRT